jgi:hypothetical protein
MSTTDTTTFESSPFRFWQERWDEEAFERREDAEADRREIERDERD